MARVLSLYAEEKPLSNLRSATAVADKNGGPLPEHAELRLEEFFELLVQVRLLRMPSDGC